MEVQQSTGPHEMYQKLHLMKLACTLECSPLKIYL